jgi:hypothetical protein
MKSSPSEAQQQAPNKRVVVPSSSTPSAPTSPGNLGLQHALQACAVALAFLCHAPAGCATCKG